MTDQEFLAWIHERLEYVHHEDPHMEYMHALRAIVLATPARPPLGQHGQWQQQR